MLSTFVANDVRQTLDQFRRSVDQVFENFYGQARPAAVSTSTEQTWTFSPVVESAWDNDVLSLRVILPGVSDKDVRVSVQNNQLILEGERKLPQGFEKNAATQLTYGKFQAALALPGGLDLDHIGCQLQHGILAIQIPVAETAKPKQIQVRIDAGENRRSLGA